VAGLRARVIYIVCNIFVSSVRSRQLFISRSNPFAKGRDYFIYRTKSRSNLRSSVKSDPEYALPLEDLFGSKLDAGDLNTKIPAAKPK